MSVTGCNFQLEASIFRMGHLMDAQLAKYVQFHLHNYLSVAVRLMDHLHIVYLRGFMCTVLRSVCVFLCCAQCSHSEEIETIVSNAKQELALENEFLSIEEEWTEQVHSYTHSLGHSLIHSLGHSLIHSLTHSLGHSFGHSLTWLTSTHSLIHQLLTHSPTHSLTLTHSLTHSHILTSLLVAR